MSEIPEADYDSSWKEALDEYLPKVLAVYFPPVAAMIDWSRGFESLEQELARLLPETGSRPRRVDKLARVFRLDGGEQWLLIHLEIQSFAESGFEERIFRYYGQLKAAHREDIVTLVILADTSPNWRPSRYEFTLGGFRVLLEFPACKLLDLVAELPEDDHSVPAVLARAQIVGLRERNPERRLGAKWNLIRSLYDHGYGAEEIRRIFRFIDGMITLPNDLESQLEESILAYEAEQAMPFITSIERRAVERGIAEGLERGRVEGRNEGRSEGRNEGIAEGRRRAVLTLLSRAHGAPPEDLSSQLESLTSEDLDALLVDLLEFTSLEDFRRWLSARARRG